MATPRIRLYIAMSVDGFIAVADGGIGWLDPFQGPELGYEAFLAGVGSLVMGRATYDQVRTLGSWPYAGKRVVVLTNRPLEAAPAGVEPYAGDVELLAGRLLTDGSGDVWLVGGANAARPFLARRLVDRLELFVIPVLLGDGIRLFEPGIQPLGLRREAVEQYTNGAVQLVYGRARPL